MCTAWSSQQVRASKEVNCQTFWKQCLVNSKRSQALRSFQFIPYTIVLPRLLDCKWAIFLGHFSRSTLSGLHGKGIQRGLPNLLQTCHGYTLFHGVSDCCHQMHPSKCQPGRPGPKSTEWNHIWETYNLKEHLKTLNLNMAQINMKWNKYRTMAKLLKLFWTMHQSCFEPRV